MYSFDFSCYREDEYSSVHCTISDNLEICGFMDLQDIASPATVSRHLVLPVQNKNNNTGKNT